MCGKKSAPSRHPARIYRPNGAARANGVAAAGLIVVVALQLAKLLHGAAPNTLLIR